MGYSIENIEYVEAQKLPNKYKSDVRVRVRIGLKHKKLEDFQNLQIKLTTNLKGFNQIDKRYVSKYKNLWSIPDDISNLLKFFTGELLPNRKNTKDTKRMYMNEFSNFQKCKIINFFEKNKIMIVNDLIRGSGIFSADWILVIFKKLKVLKWGLEPINYCLNLYGSGSVKITKRGSLRIGLITMQRKGGDKGAKSSTMLQFKIDPNLLLNKKV